MTRWFFLCALACACGRDSNADRLVVTLWHAYTGDEQAALEAQGMRFRELHPEITVRMVSVPFDAFSDKITAAIPNGNGPDLFIYAHDRIGDWSQLGLLEPVEFFVDESVAERFDYQPIAAMAYRDSLYGLPLAVKSLALFYRTDLVPTPPSDTDTLWQIGRKLTYKQTFGLVYDDQKLYQHAPWLFGFGGAVFDDQENLAISTPAAARALVFARNLLGPGGIAYAADGQLAATLFQEGRAAMVISGPWFVGGIPQGVPYKVAPLPVVNATGKPAAPFLGVEGVLMSSRAVHKREAFMLMDFLASDEGALERALKARQVVPNRRAYEDQRVAADPILMAFRDQAKIAVPMPSIPAMRVVWTPYDKALERVLAQGETPTKALAEAEREAKEYLEGAR